MSATRIGAFACALCLMTPVVGEAADVVTLVPEDAYGYVILNQPQQLEAKIQETARRMDAPVPNLIDMLGDQLGIETGVDTQGSFAVVFAPGADEPAAMLFISVDDYDAFLAQLEPGTTENGVTPAQFAGESILVAEKQGYAVVTEARFETALQRVLSGASGALELSDETAVLVNEHDFAVVFTPSGIEALASAALEGLENVKSMLGQYEGEDSPILAGIEVYVRLTNAVRSEVDSYAGGVKLDDQGALRVHEIVQLNPDGVIAPLVRDAPPYEGDLLGGIPEMPFVIAGGVALPPGAFEPMMDFSGDMIKSMSQLYGLTDSQVDQMMGLAVKYMPDVHGMSFVIGVGEGDEPLYSEMMVTMYVDDAPSFVESYKNYWAELEELVKDAPESFLADASMEEGELDGTPILKFSMPMAELLNRAGVGPIELSGIMDKVYGPGGFKMYMAAGGEDKVFMAYTGTSLLRKAIATADQQSQTQLSQESGVAATAELLPAGAKAVGYWSPTGTMAFANRAIRVMSGSEDAFQIPPFPSVPPVGLAMTTAPSTLVFDSVVPAESIETLGKFVQQMWSSEQAE